MIARLGQIAPNFEQDSTHGRIRFHVWLGSDWGVLFSHPRNFTQVCTTELGDVARLRPEWDKCNVKPIGLWFDPVEAHLKWEDDIKETQGQALDFPMIADPDGQVPALYNMIHPESDPTVTVRSVLVIDRSQGATDPHLPAEHRPRFCRDSASHRQPAIVPTIMASLRKQSAVPERSTAGTLA